MGKSRDIKGLFEGGSDRLTSLSARSRSRSAVLRHVITALPADLAKAVATAGFEDGKLTVGVVGAAWATRMRYVTDSLRTKVAKAMGVEIHSVRIKVVHPPV